MTDYYKNITKNFLSLSLQALELRNAQLGIPTTYLDEINIFEDQSKCFVYKFNILDK